MKNLLLALVPFVVLWAGLEMGYRIGKTSSQSEIAALEKEIAEQKEFSDKTYDRLIVCMKEGN